MQSNMAPFEVGLFCKAECSGFNVRQLDWACELSRNTSANANASAVIADPEWAHFAMV